MACLDMYNSDQQQHKGSHQHQHHHHHCPPPPMSPRISFSNDFADSHQMMMMKQERSSSSSSSSKQPSSDFEFSVTGYSMMSADELFSKGRILPFKDTTGSSQMQRPTTIREELLVDEEDSEVSLRPPRGGSAGRWKGFLGLRRSHIGSKKVEDNRRSGNFVHEQSQVQGYGNGDMEK